MTQYVTLEIEIDEDAIDEVMNIHWNGVENGRITGRAEVDIEVIMREVVTEVSLAESNVPTEVAMAIEQSIGKPVWENNLEELVDDEGEFVEIDN